jgi:hypothetical protein
MYWMRTVDNAVHRYMTRAWSEAMGYQYIADLYISGASMRASSRPRRLRSIRWTPRPLAP